MGRWTITINDGNSDVPPDDLQAIARILRKLANHFQLRPYAPEFVRDDNGNTIGRVDYQPD